MPAPNTIPDNLWEYHADLFELGLKHGCEIAQMLGVSPQVVSRRMKQMGAIKGCRSHLTVEKLEAFFDRRERRSFLKDLSDSERISEQRKGVEHAIDQMMASIMDADRLGNISLANEQVTRTADTLGVKIIRGKVAN